MKTLMTLSVLQTIGIAALVVHTFHKGAPDVRAANPPMATVSAVAPGIDEQRLRAVIREEFARGQVAIEALPAAASQPRNASADRQRREVVEQRIEAYSSAGAITEAQMAELQAEIAKLDESSRKEMMSRLVRALNAGDIKGRL